MAATAAQQQFHQTTPSSSPPPPPTSPLSRWTPTFPTGFINILNPFASDTTTNNTTDGTKDNAAHANTPRRSFFAGVLFSETPAAGPPSPSSSSAKSIIFAEPDTRSTSDVDSREGSINVVNKRASKTNRPKTRYSVCHPPPASLTRAKLHRRPRSLLQFHKLSSKSRPTPAFDIIPSANFNVRLTRSVTQIFPARHGLCTNDLLVLHAESYSPQEEDEELDARDIIGLICKGRKEDDAPCKAKICVANGKEWEAYPLSNGGYEFSTVDEHGLTLTVRWVLKRARDRDGNIVKHALESQKKRFNFSTISPTSRRHPVIANLTSTGLDINDTYKLPSSTTLETPNVTPRQASILSEAMDNESVLGTDADPDLLETDDELRQLIILTSVWVTFKEGWSPTFRYDDKDKDRDAAAKAAVHTSPVKTLDSPLASPALGPVDRPGSTRSISAGGFFRKGSLRRANRASIISSVPSVDEEDESQVASEDVASTTSRRRADSNSTVIMHSTPSVRRKSSRQATWRPDLLASTKVVQETSRENSMDVRPPPVVQRASWQTHSVDYGRASSNSHVVNNLSEPEEVRTVKAEHSDLDSKTISTTADTSSESGMDNVRVHRPNSVIAAPSPAKSVSQKKNNGGWRKLWCMK